MLGTNDFDLERIVPTGRIIKEYLDEYGISQKELSLRTGISEKHVSNVLNGNNRLTEEFALKLEKILVDIPASYWLNYESKYREQLARNEELLRLDQINLKEISKRFYFKEVFKGLDLSIIEQAIEMLKLLKISDFGIFETVYGNLAVSFMEDGGEKEAIAVWLGICEKEIELQNSELGDKEFSEKNLAKNLHKFKLLANNKDTEKSLTSCRKLCNQLGIYLVIHEPIVNSKVRGALTTYNNYPAIFLSGRFKTHDHIWFAFIHELAHLIKHYNKKDPIISYEDEEKYMDQREIEANQFARDFFIKPEDYKYFTDKKEYNEISIRDFSTSQGIVPGIVVARLQHDKEIDFDKFNFLK